MGIYLYIYSDIPLLIGLIRNENKEDELFTQRNYSALELRDMVNSEAIGGHRGLTLYKLDLDLLTEEQWKNVQSTNTIDRLFRPGHRELADLVRAMLVTDCRLRPDAKTVLNHPFLTSQILERDEKTLNWLFAQSRSRRR